MKGFWTCTALVWGGVGVCAALFFVGFLEVTTSTKIGLYAISIWLNAWMLVFLLPQKKGLSKLDLYIPLIFGYFGVKLLMEDWRQCSVSKPAWGHVLAES